MLYYDKSVRAALSELDTSEHGLSSIDAEERLRIHGANRIIVRQTPLWKRLIEPFASVFMGVLFIAALISFWHHAYIDGVIILVIITISVLIHYIQRFSTERILRSLQQHDIQHIAVYRDGEIIAVDIDQLVVGDVIILREGEKIPADARLITATHLHVNERFLTGETAPVSKQTEPLSDNKDVAEQTNIVFQGAFVTSGSGTAVVVATGNDTEFGQLAALTQETSSESPVQQKIDKLINQIVIMIIAIALVAFGLSILRGMDVESAISFVLALSVSAVPESLPLAISVILVLAMRRMATGNALATNMGAIETIGALTTIATDKTGALTKNKLSVSQIWQPANSLHTLTDRLGSTINQAPAHARDPLDTALEEYCNDHHLRKPHTEPITRLVFDPSISMSGNVWRHESHYQLDVKGAPEHILQHSQLTTSEHEAATLQLHRLSGQGYRVIALATVVVNKPIVTFHELPQNIRFDFVGFIAVSDVLRPEARRAVKAALEAHVSVRMITGDHLETAFAVAKQLGITASRAQIFDARHMTVMSDDELEHAIRDIRVFARVTSEHKYRILTLLKRHHITAMTGDGVTDAPALTAAHAGVAMGSGAQIAKDASDIILLDDNFKSIIVAMREGRIADTNIRRMLYYLLATNAGEVLTMLGALLIGVAVPLLPVQILWVNLVTDILLVIPLGLEKGERNVMSRPPKKPGTPILSRFLITRMVLLAFGMAAVTLTIYTIYLRIEGLDYARTIAFSALVVMQWSSAYNARSEYESLFTRLFTRNWPIAIGLTIAIIAQLIALFGPLGSWLHLDTVLIGDLVITSTIAFVFPCILVEIHKFVGRRIFHKGRPA